MRGTVNGSTKCIFRRCLNVCTLQDGEEVMSEGKSFHVHAPATGKARRSTVESLRTGTNRLSVVKGRSLSRRDVSSARELRSISMNSCRWNRLATFITPDIWHVMSLSSVVARWCTKLIYFIRTEKWHLSDRLDARIARTMHSLTPRRCIDNIPCTTTSVIQPFTPITVRYK